MLTRIVRAIVKLAKIMTIDTIRIRPGPNLLFPKNRHRGHISFVVVQIMDVSLLLLCLAWSWSQLVESSLLFDFYARPRLFVSEIQ